MAVPKRRQVRARTRSRRSQHDKIDIVMVTTCPNCKEPVRPHHVCRACGEYKGRAVLEIVTRDTEATAEADA